LASAVRNTRVPKAAIGWELDEIEAAVLGVDEGDSDDESTEGDGDDKEEAEVERRLI
jgi:hypothetical protein